MGHTVLAGQVGRDGLWARVFVRSASSGCSSPRGTCFQGRGVNDHVRTARSAGARPCGAGRERRPARPRHVRRSGGRLADGCRREGFPPVQQEETRRPDRYTFGQAGDRARCRCSRPRPSPRTVLSEKKRGELGLGHRPLRHGGGTCTRQRASPAPARPSPRRSVSRGGVPGSRGTPFRSWRCAATPAVAPREWPRSPGRRAGGAGSRAGPWWCQDRPPQQGRVLLVGSSSTNPTHFHLLAGWPSGPWPGPRQRGRLPR